MRQVPLPLPCPPLQAEEQALAARRDAAEMNALKQQLHALQLAGGGASGVAAGGKENSNSAAGGAAAGAGRTVGPPTAGAAGAAAAGAHHAQAPGGVVLQGQLCEAVQRLLRERELLLSRWAAAGWVGGLRQCRGWLAAWAEAV